MCQRHIYDDGSVDSIKMVYSESIAIHLEGLAVLPSALVHEVEPELQLRLTNDLHEPVHVGGAHARDEHRVLRSRPRVHHINILRINILYIDLDSRYIYNYIIYHLYRIYI